MPGTMCVAKIGATKQVISEQTATFTYDVDSEELSGGSPPVCCHSSLRSLTLGPSGLPSRTVLYTCAIVRNLDMKRQLSSNLSGNQFTTQHVLD